MMPGSTVTLSLEKSKILIAEGASETACFAGMISRLGLEDIQVINSHGKDNIPPLLRSLPGYGNFGKVTSLAIVRDADASCADAFRSVLFALERAGLPRPSEMGQFADGSPRVGIYVTPDCKNEGMLEDICEKSIKARPEFSCIETFFECVGKSTGTSPKTRQKAFVYAWLSTRERPELRLGEAVSKGYFDLNSEAFLPLREFLSQL